MLTEALRVNPHNRDLLEKLQGKVLTSDLRHVIWRTALNDVKQEQEYNKLLRTDRILTISQFETNIMNETQNFVTKYANLELFDSMMIQCMKTILSYYEKNTDMIVSDYNYMLTMPLIVCFAELR